MTRPVPRLAEALLVVVALTLPLLAVEAFLRLKGKDTRSWTRPDPILGWTYIPGAMYTHVSSEGCPGWTSTGRINAHGLRDREFDAAKPEGTFRILALGDSFTEAFQFDLESTWTKLLEARLNERGAAARGGVAPASGGATHVEVLNAGRSGMGTTHEWLYFAHEGKKFGADVVLLLFIPNDVQDNSKRLALATAYGPYLVPAPDGSWTVDFSFRESRDYEMRRRMTSLKRASYLVSAGLDRYSAWRAERAARATAAARGGAASAVDSRASKGLGVSWTEEDFLWVEEPEPEWAEAFAATVEALRRLQTDVAATGARLVVVNGTSRIQVHPAEIAETLAAHPEWDLDRPGARLRAACDALGVAFHDLVPEFREAAAPGGIYLHGCAENGGEGHWSAEGNRLAAASIARFLESALAPAIP